MPESYDPDCDFEMFSVMLQGLALKIVFSDEDNVMKNERVLDRIIELYK